MDLAFMTPPRFIHRANASPRPAAVIIGTNTTGLTVARALRALDVEVLGIDAVKHNPTSYSSAWTGFSVSASFNSPMLIDDCIAAARHLTRKPVLFVCTDEQVKLVGAHGQHLKKHFLFEQASTSVVDLLMNKQSFSALADAKGWPVPKTWTVNTTAELVDLANRLSFPVILKPRVKNQLFRESGAPKASRCGNMSELLNAYTRFNSAEPEAVIQEWVEGSDSSIRFSFHYLTAAGDEVVRFEGRKIRQWLPACGSTSSATRCADERVGSLSARILRECGAVGLCSVEYKHDPSRQRYTIMEPTIGRPNLQLGAAQANGIDIIGAAYAHLTGGTLPLLRPRNRRATWVIIPSDFRSARYYLSRGELTLGAWMGSYSWPVVPSVWRPFDLGIHTALLRRVVGKALRTFRKLIGQPSRTSRES